MSIDTEADSKDCIIDALKTELDSALRVLIQTLLGTKTAARIVSFCRGL